MKFISFILILLLLYSCSQRQQKEHAKTEPVQDSLTIEPFDTTDSTDCGNFSITIDTAYLYARPDSNAISGAYLTKDELVMICGEKGEFGYVLESRDSGYEGRGWVKLKYLKEIFFNPPEIRKD